jgi:hypothetical protein
VSLVKRRLVTEEEEKQNRLENSETNFVFWLENLPSAVSFFILLLLLPSHAVWLMGLSTTLQRNCQAGAWHQNTCAPFLALSVLAGELQASLWASVSSSIKWK